MGAWVAEKLDQRLPVPRFNNAVARGVRVSNVIGDKPAAYISYDSLDAAGDPKRIGLFVLDDSKEDVPADPLPAIQMANSQGYNVAVWRDKEILYVMTTDLDERDRPTGLVPPPARDAVVPHLRGR